jgi:hypothetical protein
MMARIMPVPRIKAYIDIDGVLLRKDGNAPRLIPRFRRVIRYLRKHFDCYWLTTHVRYEAGAAGAIIALAPYLKESRISSTLLDGIKPTIWRTLKTEAIDFDQPFIWLDDGPLLAEIAILRSKGRLESLVAVDWRQKSMRLTVRRLKRVRRAIFRRALTPARNSS